jgi:hypothetical protein
MIFANQELQKSLYAAAPKIVKSLVDAFTKHGCNVSMDIDERGFTVCKGDACHTYNNDGQRVPTLEAA